MACVRCGGAQDGQATHDYCKQCWSTWGKFVVRGGQYELPAEAADLANRAGILLRPSKRRAKNFRCDRCNRDLTQWELLNHLFMEHKHNATSSTGSESSDDSRESDSEEAILWETRWEYLALDGEKKAWQAFWPEAQEEIEKNHKNGIHSFDVQTNGCRYEIDLSKLVQKNSHTGRARKIRRHRKFHSSAAQKFTELEQQVQELGCDIVAKDNMLDKKAVEVRTLRSQVQEVAGSFAEKDLQLKNQVEATGALEESFRQKLQLQVPVLSSYPEGPWVEELQEALKKTSHCEGRCTPMKNLEIVKIEKIHNISLWSRYSNTKDRLRSELKEEKVQPTPPKSLLSDLLQKTFPFIQLDEEVGEALLLHGTRRENKEVIAKKGFNERLSGSKGLYGQGIYFADQSCKCYQYSGAAGGSDGIFIVARVLLGDPFIAKGTMLGEREAPERDPSRSPSRYNSVIADAGTPHVPHANGLTSASAQVHREYIVYDGGQAFPEMVIHFRV
ncbi:TNKS2 [Symbiodinium sp. CCMP2592]|nr:TNKS2 [Symbiodinium sp. CCMP2592]